MKDVTSQERARVVRGEAGGRRGKASEAVMELEGDEVITRVYFAERGELVDGEKYYSVKVEVLGLWLFSNTYFRKTKEGDYEVIPARKMPLLRRKVYCARGFRKTPPVDIGGLRARGVFAGGYGVKRLSSAEEYGYWMSKIPKTFPYQPSSAGPVVGTVSRLYVPENPDEPVEARCTECCLPRSEACASYCVPYIRYEKADKYDANPVDPLRFYEPDGKHVWKGASDYGSGQKQAGLKFDVVTERKTPPKDPRRPNMGDEWWPDFWEYDPFDEPDDERLKLMRRTPVPAPQLAIWREELSGLGLDAELLPEVTDFETYAACRRSLAKVPDPLIVAMEAAEKEKLKYGSSTVSADKPEPPSTEDIIVRQY